MKNKVSPIIGNRIKYYRTSLNQSQEVLAEHSNLTSGYIGQVERGEKNPTVDTLYYISTALDIPLSRLFSDIEDISSPIDESESLLEIQEYIHGLSPTKTEQLLTLLRAIRKITEN